MCVLVRTVCVHAFVRETEYEREREREIKSARKADGHIEALDRGEKEQGNEEKKQERKREAGEKD